MPVSYRLKPSIIKKYYGAEPAMASGKREIVQGKYRQYYVHRRANGTFQKWVNRGNSQKHDMIRRRIKPNLKSGYGHTGDHKRRRR